jgi:thiosulfate dehydrogenase [quinone] large subunit
MKNNLIEDAPWTKFLFNNPKASCIWLLARIYVGWQWLEAGWGKVHSSAWVGPDAGSAMSGFINGALAKAVGAHPDVQGWYAYFLEHLVLPHANTWSHIVSWGELLVGVALILGIFTGIAAFFGLFMNLNYLLAGTVSTNPILFILSIGILLAWRISGYIGVDHYLLPRVGTPWQGKKDISPSSEKV